jgi:Spy/CpxP family protein refolding chaperone
LVLIQYKADCGNGRRTVFMQAVINIYNSGERMMKIIKVILVLFTVCAPLISQPTVPSDKEQLLKGEIAEQTLVAEVNGFLSPQKIISLKDQIGLTNDQQKKIEEMLENLPVSATVKGQEIVEAEENLSKLFGTGKINEKTLRTKLEAIGKLRAELRFVHLQVYLQVKQFLSFNQWERLKEVQTSEIK